ncbi:hypothetical protein CO705_22265 [Ralstonia pickettii]|nr:hypothetical protein CO705_22265 [Ralstonia pickettii]
MFFCCWCIPISYPAGHDSLFFVLPKKSKQKKGAPEMAKDSLNFRKRAEAGKTRFAQTVPHLRPLTKIQGAIKRSTSKEKGQPIARLAFVVWACALMVWLLSFDFPALDGALNFCCREEKGRETV